MKVKKDGKGGERIGVERAFSACVICGEEKRNCTLFVSREIMPLKRSQRSGGENEKEKEKKKPPSLTFSLFNLPAKPYCEWLLLLANFSTLLSQVFN